MKSTALLLLLSAQTLTDRGAPPLTVTGSPEQGLQFVVERFPFTKGPDVDAMILAEASRRCSPKVANFSSFSTTEGDLTVDGKVMPGVLRYQRMMLCADPVGRGTLAPADFKPSADDATTVLRAFAEYFAAFDNERVDMVQRLSDGPPMPDERVAEMMRSFKANVGVVERVPQYVTWKINPPDQSHNGVFADISYYQNLPDNVTLCGLALFYRVDANTYRLSRIMMHRAPTPTDGKSQPCMLYKVEPNSSDAVKR
jgi:hypothetical protein